MMSKWNFSLSLLRGISDTARELVALTSAHRLPSSVSEAQVAPLHLPKVRVSTQHLVEMGFRPKVAQYLFDIFMNFVGRHKQILELHFNRTIHGGSRLPSEYYRDVFVVLYERTIQGWGSRFLTSAWVWLCQAGLSPVAPRVKEIGIRPDDIIKAGLPSSIRQTTLLVAMKRTDTSYCTEELPQIEEGFEEEEVLPINCIMPRCQDSTSQHHDQFKRVVSSTCFPARYPPAPSKSHTLHERTLVTSFTRAAPIQTDTTATCNVDMLSLISLFGRMNLSNLEVGTRPHGFPNGLPQNPNFKQTKPPPPLLSPIAVDTSGPSCESQLMMTGLNPTTRSTPTARRRRIAPLPSRHTTSSASSPSSNSPSSATRDSLIVAVPYGATSRAPPMKATKIYLDCVDASSEIPSLRPTQPAQSPAEVSSPSTPKSARPKRRKMAPLPRRASQPQGTASTQRTLPPPTLPGRDVSSRPVSRTPSLVSDTSSGIESASSSDELDTPPSTPPLSLHALTVRGTADGTNISPKPNVFELHPKPSLRDSALPNPREQDIHIDLLEGM